MAFTRQIRVPVGDPKLAQIDIEKFLIISIGEQAPEFAATTLDGRPFKLSELRGKVVLLDFWATWCAPCIGEMPNLLRAVEEYGGSGDFVIVGVSLDSSESAVKQFQQRRKIPWTQIVLGPAEQNPAAKKYNVSGIPATFLIDRDGKVVAKDLHGPALRRELGKLLPAVRKPTHDGIASAD
ncbi:MAG: TlpA family protein disulfide reductase [Planctomycetes bacterium]|nr:TlpA family protein disulfide reductase [Planctomycetota bacterium]